MAAEPVQVRGLDEFRRKAAELPRAMRSRVLRNALAAGAREVRDTARRNTPVLSLGAAARVPYRKPGTVRKAISVRTSKLARRRGDVGVFVNVKPAARSVRGTKSRDDPFYWRFLEFGTRFIAARPFMQRGAERLPEALKIFEQHLGKWLASVQQGGPAK